MADRKTPPLIDLAAVAVSPALIMMMVGSLAFFLIEVLYGGQWTDRLIYTFFFFVFGIVLIARLHIQHGGGKARAYGIGLGLVAYIAMLQFVEYPTPWLKTLGPIINLGLMALVWWISHKLTWDCTHLDADLKASGRGVLAAAGLDTNTSTTKAEDDAEFDPDRASQADPSRKRQRRAKQPMGWLERYQKYREWQKKKPHTPGVWVLYFAVAALPLFALGQALIPADDDKRRAATFWQMATYIGSALGLLVTTSLLGLRRYLEDRNARIPTGITVGWLGMGAAVILVFLAIGAVLPRPHSETPMFTWDRGGKSDRNASKNAQVRDNSAGKGEGNAGQKTEAGKGNASGKNGEPGGGNKGEKGTGKGDKGNNSGSKQKGESGGDQKGKEGGEKGEKGKDDPNAKGNEKGEKGKDEKDDRQTDGSNRDADEKKEDDSGRSEQGERLKNLGEAGEKVAKLIKWLVWTAIIIAVIVGALYFFLKGLAPFTNWAKGLLDWLRGLFGKKPTGKKRKAKLEEEVLAGEERPPPFHAFANPFDDGSATRRDPADLLAYSFAAFDSWAWDRNRGRTEDETPAEFAARIAEDYPDLTAPTADLADLHTRALYSPTPLPADTVDRVATVWRSLDLAGEPVGSG